MLVDSRVTSKPIKALNTPVPDSLKGWKWCCGELLKEDSVCVYGGERNRDGPIDTETERFPAGSPFYPAGSAWYLRK